ncbi:MAG: acyltransferase, partial [Planctomycetota bacterium]
AVLLVLCSHAPQWPGELATWTGLGSSVLATIAIPKHAGWAGVDLFFVLSGFLIGTLLLEEMRRHHSLQAWRFWLRRGFKIWPAYYVYLALLLLWIIVAPPARYDPFPLWQPRLERAWTLGWMLPTHLANYYFPFIGLLCAHVWSVSVEEHFYIGLPIALLAAMVLPPMRRAICARPMPWLLTLAFFSVIGCAVMRYVVWTTVPFQTITHNKPTHLRIDSLLVGVALAAVVVQLRHRKPWRIEAMQRRRWVLLPVGIAVASPAYFVSPAHLFMGIAGYPMIALGSACLVLWAWLRSVEGQASPAKPDLATRFAAATGRWSYCVYLFHMPFTVQPLKSVVLPWATEHFGDVGLVGALLAYFAASILLGAVAHAAIERPGLWLRERLIPRRPKPTKA